MPITIKHVFQNLYDKTKYDGRDAISREQYAQVGHNMQVSPLSENERLGFEPEATMINVQVPENPKDFVVEYRYNRAKYTVSYNTSGGSDIPAQVLYYGQTIPAVPEPKKIGATFKGWKASNNITFKNENDKETTVEAGKLIADKKSEFKEGMPAQNLVFTAEWENNPTADYTILYYTEKPDHEFGSTNPNNLREKYDFVGARVVQNANTGSEPDLKNMLPEGVTFPDLEGKSADIVNNAEELKKYYTYNEALTKSANLVEEDKGDGTIVNVQKKVESTGKTVYEVYYDRTVYTMIFEKTKAGSSFDPVITVYDKNTKESKVYNYGNSNYKGDTDFKEPYTITARFGQSLADKWVRDGAMGVDYLNNIFKGDKFAYISFGYSTKIYSQGWKINSNNNSQYRDVPPYRLSKREFIDFNRAKTSPTRKDENNQPISYGDKIISMGIARSNVGNFMPHHVEFELEGLDGSYHFHPEMYYWKSDTASKSYNGFTAPNLKGFTAVRQNKDPLSKHEKSRSALMALNNNRPEEEKTPFEYKDTLSGLDFKTNAYYKWRCSRNSYKLNLNSDPNKIKQDSDYTGKQFANGNSQVQDVKFEYPLANLDLPILTDDDKPEVYKQPGFDYKFKGWALDPSGVNMIKIAKTDESGNITLIKDPKALETMPDYNMTIYAVWGEEDKEWEITFDPNGGTLTKLQPSYLATHKEGELVKTTIGKKEYQLPRIKSDIGYNNTEPQTVIVNHRLTIKDPTWKPKREGYDFLGWELVRFNEDGTENTTYKEKYTVPELYAFQNEVVRDASLRAIWVPNDLVKVVAVHHFYDENGNKIREPITRDLAPKRVGSYTSAVASEQGAKYLILEDSDNANELKNNEKYKEIFEKTGRKNTYFQTMKVENPMMEDPENQGQYIKNPDVFNEFHFFYREFRTRKYKVNYFDERIKSKVEDGTATDAELKTYRIINKNSPEVVENGNKHYDARNYRSIPGWKLTSAPQQQLFFDLDNDGNLIGINGTEKDEISFYYQDIRVIEREDPKSVVPDGYHRIIFKIDPDKNGGNFGTKADGTPRTEVIYDVIDGLHSDNVPVPQELKSGHTEEQDKIYIKADPGKKFLHWDNSKLFNKNTVIQRDYEFIAYFNWAGLQIKELVRTESLNGVNNFVPTRAELKAALTWVADGVERHLPDEFNVSIDDTDDEIYNKLKELNKTDSDELVRTEKINATVDYGNGSKQKIEIPVKVYKNRYDALTTGAKPKVLVDAEKVVTEKEKEAGKKDGDLVEILKDVGGRVGQYVKVTVNPTGKPGEKDSKIYYVNPNALVDIPEITISDNDKARLGFTNWTANKKEQNEKQEENGVFNFTKRHKFTEDTVIEPGFAADVVEQTDPNKKPPVPDNYVKVIVDTTDKAIEETKFTKTFWVNPTKEVKIPVDNPAAITDWTFDKWTTGEQIENRKEIDLTRPNHFTAAETLITARYSYEPKKIEGLNPKDNPVHTPQGKTPSEEEYEKKITPPDGKTIQSVKIVENIDPKDPGSKTAKVIINYTDGSSVGTNKKPAEIKVEVHKNVIPSPDGKKPEGALDNYVVVNFVAGTGGTLSGTTNYYVSPEVEVNLTDTANGITKTPSIGYYVNGEKWTNKDDKTLQGTFTDETTTFTFKFEKSGDIVEKTPQNPDKPEGYVTVIFKTDGNGKLAGDVEEKTYYVNPNAGITLKELQEGETATEKQLAVPATIPNTNYVFDKWFEEIDEATPITSNRIHVAQFKFGEVTLTYNAGEGKGNEPVEQKASYGSMVKLAEPTGLSKENSTFIGWKLDGDDTIYQPKEGIKLDRNRTATAQWSTNDHTVEFDTQSKDRIEDQKVKHGSTITNVTPTHEDKVFMGWTLKGNIFDVATPITEDITLIALWQDPVQEIGENDTVEDKFIKVIFSKGSHGTIKVGENISDNFYYKVAKNLNFSEAVAKGMIVPEISSNDYYKVKAENEGWDKALELADNNIEFTAQYEPIADVIPINPDVTPDEKIGEHKPDNYVVVRFIVDENKAFMTENSKFYVARNKEVTFKAPVAYNKIKEIEFDGWTDTLLSREGNVTRVFDKDTDIVAKGREIPTMEIKLPRAGESIINILSDLNGAVGKVEFMENGIAKIISSEEKVVTSRRGRRNVTTKYVLFDIGRPLQEGELIRYWVEKDGAISEVRDYTVK